MAIEIPNALVEFILLGPTDDRRQLQDSPILGDVWGEFAKQPDARRDLLITPYMLRPAGIVARVINERYDKLNIKPSDRKGPNIAYLQGIIAAQLSFVELIRIIVPLTGWWHEKYIKDERGKITGHELKVYGTDANTTPIVEFFVASAKEWHDPAPGSSRRGQKAGGDASRQGPQELSSLDRYAILTGLILWAMEQNPRASASPGVDQIGRILNSRNLASGIAGKLVELMQELLKDAGTIDASSQAASALPHSADNSTALVWQVSLNRTANPALAKSVPAVKADAAKFLFKVDTSSITWAVIDSGIDGSHPAFRKADLKGIRVKRSFDFRNFRQIVSLSNTNESLRKANVGEILQHGGLKINKSGKSDEEIRAQCDGALKTLAEDADRGTASVHWGLVETLVEIDPTYAPASNHGTHVAGIIGASKEAVLAHGPADKKKLTEIQDGMCPEINLFDFRVLGPTMKDTEFAIIGVLQYIRYLNDRDNFMSIHGANLSLSIAHDVRNFACGRTPICNECERLVESGVVVVAAAGNHGYKSFQTKEGAYEGYNAFSITDPGNADGVITVGATHRNWPHTYGISFFSSRGPTGDGRLKPDLVAPGERIRAPFPRGLWGELDGTSMAAPHVSGAAAMLMARYSELIGQPRRIKRILCETATDLGRERTFQGHGMLDVLRAFQSI